MIVLNKKEYPDNGVFTQIDHPEFCNLKIYPLVGILEKEAGILSDLAEAYVSENIKCNCIIYTDLESERVQLLNDNLLNFENKLITKDEYLFTNKNINIVLIDESFNNYSIISGDIILSKEHILFDKSFKYKIKISEKTLYLNDYDTFMKYFWYYFDDSGNFNYDNLICFTMIVKNAGPLLAKVLTENLPIIDRWCILDTGSTDGTQDIIRSILKNKKGKLYEEPFVNFKVSRNRCLELAGNTCKFILMVDDTYILKGNLRKFLNEVRGDQFSDSFSLLIQSDDTEYYSNRIIKTTTGLRYIHIIHEVITNENNKNVTIPDRDAYIFDERAEYMETRTNNRKQFDLELLFKEVEEDPDDPRALYYIAQTYGCIGDELSKAKYFELRIRHPVEGYFQEKIDSLFELARTYNFKVNCETKELMKAGEKLTESQWKKCEELYLQAYALDNKRPDSLYFIGIHYYLLGNYQLAYKYFKMGFEVGYPLGSQYSLKPTLTFHFLPKFLAEVCYYIGDYSLGLAASNLFLISNKYNTPSSNSWNLMMNWYSIHKNLNGMVLRPPTDKGRIFCIVTDGGWEPWSGKDILTKGLGGSETWVIETAKYVKEYFNVVVFCKTDKPEMFEGVGYNPIELFREFISSVKVEYCIISRFTEYAHVATKGHAENIGIIFHDVLVPDTIIPTTDKLKWVIGLTDWHSNTIKNTFPNVKVFTLNYGINPIPIETKVKNSFIYSSFPNRGLVVLLRIWPKIISKLPDATLNIYCNLEQEWVNKVAPETMREIKALLKVNKKGIKVHGWVSKLQLSTAWATADYFLYPCTFEETFCLTAVEAAISKTCVISNNLAGLSETIGNRGIIIHGDPYSEEWQKECLDKLFNIDLTVKNELISINYRWASERSWKYQTEYFLKVLNVGLFKKYWYRNEEINKYLLIKTKNLKNVVDIGSGKLSFENATITIDMNLDSSHKINVETEELPHQHYDFIYSRHLLEDLQYPELVLSEIKKKGRAGYIETPSPFAECCRAIDFDSDYNLYRHHHSILWTENNTLMVLPKISDFLKDIDQTSIRKFLENPIAWNNYHLFEKSDFEYKILKVPSTKAEYLKLIENAFKLSNTNSNFISNYILQDITKTELNHGNMLNWFHDVPSGTRATFENALSKLPSGSKILEIGTFVGLGLVEILKKVPQSSAVVIDPWENYDEHDNLIGMGTQSHLTEDVEKIFYENIKGFERRISILKGKSHDKLLELLLSKELFDFIYVDASHKCLDVYFDSVISWSLLKIGGIIAFDDYQFNRGDILNSPYEAIEKFKSMFFNDFIIINSDYRVYIKKIR
jgi:predicted O-methyltransferase YrrM